MENTRTSNRNFGMMAWGAIFLWWGITELFKFPNGTDAVGFGLIFLGVNVMRALNGIPTKRLTTMLGILALVWGGLNLAPLVLHLPFKLPVFAILLIVLGVILLAFVPLASSKDQFGGLVDTRFEAKCPRNASPRYLHFRKEFLTMYLENGRDVIRGILILIFAVIALWVDRTIVLALVAFMGVMILQSALTDWCLADLFLRPMGLKGKLESKG